MSSFTLGVSTFEGAFGLDDGALLRLVLPLADFYLNTPLFPVGISVYGRVEGCNYKTGQTYQQQIVRFKASVKPKASSSASYSFQEKVSFSRTCDSGEVKSLVMLSQFNANFPAMLFEVV